MMAAERQDGQVQESVNAFLAFLLICLVMLVPIACRHWLDVSRGLKEADEIAANLPNWPLQETEHLPSVVVDQDSKDDSQLKPEVVMFSRPGCPPCDYWWMTHRPAWEKKGWPVKKVEYSGPVPTPFFDVCDGEKRFRVDGMLTFESYKKAGGR